MKKIDPIKAIRLKCLDCSNGQVAEVERCEIKYCPLYPFRLKAKRNKKAVE